MFFRSPLPSLGLLKTVTLVLAILLPMSWPCFVTYVLATDPPERPSGFRSAQDSSQWLASNGDRRAEPRLLACHHRKRGPVKKIHCPVSQGIFELMSARLDAPQRCRHSSAQSNGVVKISRSFGRVRGQDIGNKTWPRHR